MRVSDVTNYSSVDSWSSELAVRQFASWQRCNHESRRISIVLSHNEATASEGIANWEDLVCAVVKSRVRELVRAL